MSNTTFKAVMLKTEGTLQVVTLSKRDWFKEGEKVLDIDTVDLPSIRLDGTLFDLMVDDEALLKQNASVTICGKKELNDDYWHGPEPLIAGPVLFMHGSGLDEDGYYLPLDITFKDLDILNKHICYVTETRIIDDRPHDVPRTIITGADYA